MIFVIQVDLRWGITERQVRDQQALAICLREVEQSHIFVSFIGKLQVSTYYWCVCIEAKILVMITTLK